MSGLVPIALLFAVLPGHPVSTGGLKPRTITQPTPKAANFTLNVSPATITFNATNPNNAPVVAGSSTASLTWTSLSSGGNWSLTVQSSSPTFTNCPTVPISAVTVTCASASVGSLGGSASCGGAFPLSTTATQVAGGTEGVIALNYSVTINFTLSDQWKYIAETSPACSLTLTYTANVP